MSALPGPAYHFRTEAQWELATAAGVGEEFVLDPRAGEPVDAELGCSTMVLAQAGEEIVTVDERGRLFSGGAEGPRVGETRRLIVGEQRHWLLSHRHIVQVDRASLHLLLDRPADDVTDIAGDGGAGLWILADGRLSRMNSRGSETAIKRRPKSAAVAIAFAGGRLALLDPDRRHIDLVDPEDWTTVIRLDLAELAGGMDFGAAASLDGGEEAFLLRYRRGGETGDPGPGFLLIGAGGDLLASGRWLDDRAPALVAAAADDLLALFRDESGERLLRFPGMADPGGERRLTPLLEPESPSGTWHRADVVARLPERASLSLRWASTDDAGLARQVEKARTDCALPPSQRLARAAGLLDGSWSPRFTYVGAKHEGEAPLEQFAFPLHSAAAPFLWVELEQRRGGATAAPELHSLRILHEAHGLMEDLPAIYRADEGSETVSPLRRLVGVIEAGTQDMDARIGRVAERLDPARAEAADLPELAAMMGLPFHDALDAGRRRALVGAAPAILAQRGTRRGLLALLQALFPGRPVRVIDRTETLLPITLGGQGGTALPALLSGPSHMVPKLNAGLVLGRTPLCPATACDDASLSPAAQVALVIPVTAREYRRLAGAVTAMAEEMVPAGVRLRISWPRWRTRAAPLPVDLLTALEGPAPLSLGAGPGLGRTRTGGRHRPRLDGAGLVPVSHRLL